MSLVGSLLNAILRLDGEALVMHVGEKPYVVAPSGQMELATRPLNFDAVSGMVSQLLPAELQHALDEFGAVQYEIPRDHDFPGESFSVIAARGGEDVWVEVRRRRIPDADHVPDEFFAPPPVQAEPAAVLGFGTPIPVEDVPGTAAIAPRDPAPLPIEPLPAAEDTEPDLSLPETHHLWPAAGGEPDLAADTDGEVGGEPRLAVPLPPAPAELPPARIEPAVPVEQSRFDARSEAAVTGHDRSAHPAVVLPMTRSAIRAEAPPPVSPSTTGLDRLLRLAAARGASTLYLASEACASIRVDGEIQQLSNEAALSPGDVESLLIDLMPERNREELRGGNATEWICDVAGVGRVRCMTFRDHRGPGGIFRMMPLHAISADQLGLSREIQALAAEPEGLVLVAGPRASGKSTLLSAFVDLINRTRRDHVITIESEIKVLHDQRSSLVSQREARGSAEEGLAAARAAIRENPDVLVIEELRSPELIALALEAAGSGQLVIGALPAHTASAAIDRIIDLYPPEHRRQIQLSLAETLRGVVMQVLVRKPAGGRIAAREVLLNTPAVAGAIAEGKTSQLPSAIEAGRRYGMVPLNDALAGLVQSGSVDAREACRRAADRAGFLALLKRLGLDSGLAQLPFADGTRHD